MNRINILMACAGALTMAFGCDDGRTGDPDSGPIVLVDSGSGGTDAGMMGGDDAGPTSACSLAGAAPFAALPEGCLPRCSAATRNAVIACQTLPDAGPVPDGGMAVSPAQCQQMAVHDDTTAPTQIDFGDEMPASINCEGCWNYQLFHCFNESCPTEFQAFFTCLNTDPMPDCTSQETTFNTCAEANNSAIQTCASKQLARCLPSP